jgi:hypothetical protein
MPASPRSARQLHQTGSVVQILFPVSSLFFIIDFVKVKSLSRAPAVFTSGDFLGIKQDDQETAANPAWN